MKVSESTNALFTNSKSFGYSQTKERGTNDCNKKSHCVDKGVSDSTETGSVVENNGQESNSIGTHMDMSVTAKAEFNIPFVGSAGVETTVSGGMNTNHETSSGKW